MATTKTTLYLKFDLSTGSTYDLPVEAPKAIGETADDKTTTAADIKAVGDKIIANNIILSNGGKAVTLNKAYMRTVTDDDVALS